MPHRNKITLTVILEHDTLSPQKMHELAVDHLAEEFHVAGDLGIDEEE